MTPAATADDASFDRVRVQGSIDLGEELRPLQRHSTGGSSASPAEMLQSYGLEPTSVMARFGLDRGAFPGEALEDAFAETGRKITLDDDGFTASYGIFGCPGSGKSTLVLHMIEQILSGVPGLDHPDFNELKFGALVLDPKAALIDPFQKMMSRFRLDADRLASTGRASDLLKSRNLRSRADDLIVLNTDEMIRGGQSVNVIDTALAPRELGKVLVLAAQSSGISASEPFWFITWANLFGAALTLLEYSLADQPPTLASLLDAVLMPSREDPSKRGVEVLADEAADNLDQLARIHSRTADVRAARYEEVRTELELAVGEIRSFFDTSSGDSVRRIRIIDTFISRAYGGFQQRRNKCFSETTERLMAIRCGVRSAPNFYDGIVEEGKVVLVSISPSEPEFAKTLCTLVKCLFQQTMMARKERSRRPDGAPAKLYNRRRPALIACDEYSAIASEVPGQPMGDGHFFALARENGCMGLLATQSVNVLENSSLKESWRSVFSNFGAKIFMAAADNETVEEATKLAGDADWQITSSGHSQSSDGFSYNEQIEFRERKSLPARILTRSLQRGDAVVIGSLDGRKTRPSLRYVRVPDPDARQLREGQRV